MIYIIIIGKKTTYIIGKISEELSGICDSYGNNGEIFTSCKVESEQCEDYSEMVDFSILFIILLSIRCYWNYT